MFPADCEWFRNPGASYDALHALRKHAGVNLPDEYYQLLAYSNGGEGSLPISPFNFCLDTAEYATKNKLDKNYEEFFPGFFVFGTSGGGDYIAFDLRTSEPWPIVSIDMTNIDLAESVDMIAVDFSSFLAQIGMEKTDV